jgi:stage IV sporulation protein FB
VSGFVSLPIGRLRLRIHLLLPVVVSGLWVWSGRVASVYLLLLACLVLHELGHALASLLLGSARAEVIVLPIFGWSRVGTFPDRRQAVVALAGPASNLLLAGVLALAGAAFDLRLRQATTLDLLFTVNLLMGLGNLVPIRPLDGGRVVAALLPADAGEG